MRPNRRDFWARLSIPEPPATGPFTPQMLDALMHLSQLHPDREPSVIFFNGG